MKDQKRSYRRYKQKTILKKRAKIWYNFLAKSTKSWAEFWTEVQQGDSHVWMRNTGTPCSCYICSKYYKYKRPSKSEIDKLINEQLD